MAPKGRGEGSEEAGIGAQRGRSLSFFPSFLTNVMMSPFTRKLTEVIVAAHPNLALASLAVLTSSASNPTSKICPPITFPSRRPRRIPVEFTYDPGSDDLKLKPLDKARYPWWMVWRWRPLRQRR
jgi:hypothetical protein